jgi:hypothetical protein
MRGVLAVILVLLVQRATAQQPYEVGGLVRDSVGGVLVGATVRLALAKDTHYTMTDKRGYFVIFFSKAGVGSVQVTMKGYRPLLKNVRVSPARASVQLGTLVLRADYQELSEVVVSRVRPLLIKQDTVTYNAAAFPVLDGSEVEDILKRLPGVEVDLDGNVIVQGKKISRVLVDGKEFFGADVLLAIRNLPADVVDKLQVIDDYGDEARLTGVRSGDAAKVLNIVLKGDKRNGRFGQAEAAAGDEGKYFANAFGNSFGGDRKLSARLGLADNNPAGADPTKNAAVSYANQWNSHWGGSLSANAASQAPHAAGSTQQESFYPGETLLQNQENQTSANNASGNLDASLTYKPDGYSTLRWQGSGNLTRARSQATSQFSTLQTDSGYSKSTSGSTLNGSSSAGQSLNSNLYFEKLSHHSRRRFSVDAGVQYSGSNALSNTQSTAIVTSDSISTPSMVSDETVNNTRSLNLYGNSNYFLPLGPTSFLDLGYRVSSAISRTDVVVRQPDLGGTALVTVDSLSEAMILRSLTQDIRAAYITNFHPFDITAGLDAQPGSQQGNIGGKENIISYSYFTLLPIIQVAWSPDRGHRLNLAVTGNPTLPSLQQLSPLTNVTNPQYPVTGNPALKPSQTGNIGLHYEQSSLRPTQFFGFGMGLAYGETRHTIIQNLSTPKDSSLVIQSTTYLNAGNTDHLTADFHVNLPAFLHKRLHINVNGGVSRTEAITMTDSVQYLNRAWNWNQSIHLQLLIPDVIESDLFANYSLTRNSYTVAGSPANSFQSATVTLRNRHYFLQHWILNYQISQLYTANGARLQTAPANLTASFQRQFLAHNRGTISLQGFNLLNQTAAAGQYVSATTITESRPQLTGRYFLLSILVKLSRFDRRKEGE